MVDVTIYQENGQKHTTNAIKWTITNQCHPQYKKQNQKLKVTVLNSGYYHHEN